MKSEKYRYEEWTSPPMKHQLGVQAQSHFMCDLVLFASRPKYSRFQPDGFLFLICCNNRISRGSKRHRAYLVHIERTGPRRGHLGRFSAGEKGEATLVNSGPSAYIYVYSNSTAISVTATLLKGCSFWNIYLQQRQVYPNLRGGLASFLTLLPVVGCVAFTQIPTC